MNHVRNQALIRSLWHKLSTNNGKKIQSRISSDLMEPGI